MAWKLIEARPALALVRFKAGFGLKMRTSGRMVSIVWQASRKTWQ
jgi:hypothetical protein